MEEVMVRTNPRSGLGLRLTQLAYSPHRCNSRRQRRSTGAHSGLQHPIGSLEDPLCRLLRNGIHAQPVLDVASAELHPRQPKALTADHGDALRFDFAQRPFCIVAAAMKQNMGDLME